MLDKHFNVMWLLIDIFKSKGQDYYRGQNAASFVSVCLFIS